MSPDMMNEEMVIVCPIDIGSTAPLAWVERTARIPGSSEPFVFGVRPEFHEHYGLQENQFTSRPTTNDVFVAAVASCLTATFVGTLEARHVALDSSRFHAESRASISSRGRNRAWVVSSIHVHFSVTVTPAERAVVEHVFTFYDKGCWLSQTLEGSQCTVSSEVEYLPANA
jgi:uncharacterized OsmC-like protein